MKSRPDISGGLEFYFETVKTTRDAVMKMLDDETKYCNSRITDMQAEKDALIEKLQGVLL